MNSSDDCVCFVFSTASGSPQTVDVNNVSKDSYFEISSTSEGGKYKVDDVTDKYATSIGGIVADKAEGRTSAGVYTIDGRLVRHTSGGATADEAVSGLAKAFTSLTARRLW